MNNSYMETVIEARRTVREYPTPRQEEALVALWKTGSIKGAAMQLGISAKTVEAHLGCEHPTGGLRHRLGHPEWSLIELCKWAVRVGILTCLLLLATTLVAAAQGKQGTIFVVANPYDGGTVSGSGRYKFKSTVTIGAVANTGWQFVFWENGDTNPVRSVTVGGGTLTFAATFAKLSAGTNLVNVWWTPTFGAILGVKTPATGYMLRWGETSGGPYTNYSVALNTNLTITELANVPHYFVVQSGWMNGYSAISCEVAITKWPSTNSCGSVPILP